MACTVYNGLKRGSFNQEEDTGGNQVKKNPVFRRKSWRRSLE
jgi:hypothetical protein